MSVIALGALSAGTGLFTLYSRMTSNINNWYDDLADMPNIGSVTILMPTLNEAETVESTIASLRNQNILTVYPEYFQLIVVDSNSSDGTRELATALADGVITTPRGKLTAIAHALNVVNSDIIVAVDADSHYGTNFLNLIMKHFEEPDVVGVSGVELPKSFHAKLLAMLSEQYYYRIAPRMMGRGCGYRRESYFEVGGFDLSIDQQNITAMMCEEEFAFYRKLSQIGKVVRDYRISVETTDRRFECILGLRDSEYCRQILSNERM